MRPVSSASDSNVSRRFVHLREGIEAFLRFARGRVWEEASMRERLHAFSIAVRRPMLDAMRETERRYRDQDSKRLYYLSMEFLMGRALGNNLTNLELYDEAKAIIAELGADLEELESLEHDAALGNGGLGRLAACFLDSLATLEHARLRLRHQLRVRTFPADVRQRLSAREARSLARRRRLAVADRAAAMRRSSSRSTARIAHTTDRRRLQADVGRLQSDRRRAARHADRRLRRRDGQRAAAVHGALVGRIRHRHLQLRRLHRARCSTRSTPRRSRRSSIPRMSVDRGRELRLLQEYFLVACSVRDIVKRYLETHDSFDEFAEKVAIQMNDTHPALTVAELMRMLIDEDGLPWEQAWAIDGGDVRLHEPHAAAGGAGEVAVRSARARAAAAPADHPGDQPPPAGRGRAALSGRPGDAAARVAHRRRRRRNVRMAQPGHGRQPFGQRRRGAALGAGEDDARAGVSQALSRALQQQDERRDAAALAAARQSPAGVADHASRSATAGSAISTSCGGWSCSSTTPALLERARDGQAAATRSRWRS